MQTIEFAQDELLVEFDDSADLKRFPLKQYGLGSFSKLGEFPFYRVKITDGSGPEHKMAQLAALPKRHGLGRMELNFKGRGGYTALALPNDPRYQDGSGQYNVALTQYDRAWVETLGGMGNWSTVMPGKVVVAVLDSGLLASHQEFTGRVVGGFNALDNSNDTTDNHGHGTRVSGYCCATGGNSVGVAGFTGDNWLMPVKIDDNNTYFNSDLIVGINWAANNNASVINMSLWGTGSAFLQAACDDAYYNKHVVIVGISGNGNDTATYYPGSYDSVISVAASNHLDQHCSYSTANSTVDLAAPSGDPSWGVYPWSSNRSSPTSYSSGWGTSFSAPLVAGVAAILKANGVLWSECFTRMARTADKIDSASMAYATVAGHPIGTWNARMGYGRLNAYRCFKTLVPPVMGVILADISGVNLSWSAPPLSDTATSGYDVYRAPAATGPFSRLNATPVPGLAYYDNTVSPGQTWHYGVRGRDSHPEAFETKLSSVIQVNIPVPTPTLSPTITPTFSITETFTISPTHSASPTVTETFTASPSPSPVPTFSAGKLVQALISPNPLKGSQANFAFQVDGYAGPLKIAIFSPGYAKIWQAEFNGPTAWGFAPGWNRLPLSLPELPNGSYFVLIEMAGKRKLMRAYVLH